MKNELSVALTHFDFLGGSIEREQGAGGVVVRVSESAWTPSIQVMRPRPSNTGGPWLSNMRNRKGGFFAPQQQSLDGYFTS